MVNSTQDSTSAAALFASLNANAGASKTTSTAAETQDRFLKLLVTQMKNQDPLNPMDNAQVTTQMAQLSTVSGIDKLNATLQALSDSMLGNQALQAASMIGHGVLVPGQGTDLANSVAYGGIELEQQADKVNIAIYDKAGALIRDMKLGAQPAGVISWQWDGRDNSGNLVADGSYKFTVDASQAGDKVTATALQFGLVNSVTQDSKGVALSVGQTDGIKLSQVREIL
jgi:flagellar basal-body rod modification protein FlgD